jgi:hypothetical protein
VVAFLARHDSGQVSDAGLVWVAPSELAQLARGWLDSNEEARRAEMRIALLAHSNAALSRTVLSLLDELEAALSGPSSLP